MFTTREAGAVVRDLREARKWNQSELAGRAGVSRTFVVDVEAGKPTVEAAKLFDLVQALGYEVAFRSIDSNDLLV